MVLCENIEELLNGEVDEGIKYRKVWQKEEEEVCQVNYVNENDKTVRLNIVAYLV